MPERELKSIFLNIYNTDSFFFKYMLVFKKMPMRVSTLTSLLFQITLEFFKKCSVASISYGLNYVLYLNFNAGVVCVY